MVWVPFLWSALYLSPRSNFSFLFLFISVMGACSLGLLHLLTLAPGAYIGPIGTRAGAILLLPDAGKDRAALGTAADRIPGLLAKEIIKDQKKELSRVALHFQVGY